ncbi:hypothetical protein JIG36_13500 [Actinoplanes sp. LDG1-06]|uniref:Uncharacterized protein n=1 Tax=Paractinoplanes ovalisporus TaxID=2810368 RepID=A0ABS2A9R2_9ACTN|nr:hypothetical protein [Actinoplanes ovalisporus]MBM2616574.1 hypothetical protein [Actinoplanes ovalisporus]
MNPAAPPPVPLGMWDDGRLLAALAALPPEAFIEGPADDDDLRWRRTARRLRRELGAEPARSAPPEGHLAPVLELRPNPVD